MALKKNIFILAAILLFPALTFAQGSGSTGGSGKTKTKKSNFTVTRAVSGTVNSISANSISIKTKSGNISLKISRNTAFSGGRPRKNERVKVSYSATDQRAISIRRS